MGRYNKIMTTILLVFILMSQTIAFSIPFFNIDVDIPLAIGGGFDADTFYQSSKEEGVTAGQFANGKYMKSQSYYSSFLYAEYDGSVVSGVKQLNFKEAISSPFSELLRLKTTHTIQDFRWYPHKITYDFYNSNNFRGNGWYSFVNEDTIILSYHFEELKGKEVNLTFSGTVGSVSSYSITRLTDGLSIHTNHLKDNNYGQNVFNFDWLLKTSTPTTIKVNGNYYEFLIPLLPYEKKDIVFILTLKKREGEILEHLTSPESSLNNAKNKVEWWINLFKTPTFSNKKLRDAYYRNIIAAYQLVRQPIYQENKQNLGNILPGELSFSASLEKYFGIFSSDTAKMLLGFLRSSDNPYTVEFTKGVLDIFIRNAKNGVISLVIRETVTDNGNDIALLPCVLYEVSQRDDDYLWLENTYNIFKTTLLYFERTKTDSNGLYYCGGLECGDGRDKSVASEVNAQYYLDYKCMARISKKLGNTIDENIWEQKSHFLDGKIQYFWNEELGMFVDLKKDTLQQKLDVYPYGTGFGLGGLLMTKHPEITLQQATRIAQTAHSQNWNTPYIFPDIPINDKKYTNACTLWWCGKASPVIWEMTVNGLNAFRLAEDAEYFKDKGMDNIASWGSGWENYNSQTPTREGLSKYGWTIFYYIQTANSMELYNFPHIPFKCSPSDEVCDGIDNSCDGTIDEGCSCINGRTQQCGTTDIGECSFGVQTCSNGVWSVCEGSIEPVEETFDQKDNDCDGQIDEDFKDSCTNIWDFPNCFGQWNPIKITIWFNAFVNWVRGIFGNII